MSIPHRPYPRVLLQADTSSGGGEWTATEKIHGASFVVATDGERVLFGKRKAWLDPSEPFFGWQLLRAELKDAARRVHACFAGSSGAHVVRIYGELFGGAYPHPDVPAIPGLQPVQTGIWYSPRVELALFDILVEREDEARFVGHDELVRAAERSGLRTVPVVARGSRADLFQLAVRRESLVPASLGLPPIAGNLAEGLVFKPAASLPPERRPLVKRKIAEFSESRFGEARPFDASAFLSLAELEELCRALVNPARIASARSKAGESSDAVRQEVVLDVLSDLEALLPHRFAGLSADELAALERHIDALAREV